MIVTVGDIMQENTLPCTEDIVDKALKFAMEAHRGQIRKCSAMPAIMHAMEAAVIAATMTTDTDVMAAALLHDTVEDTDVIKEQVLQEFGPKIAALVESETEDKHDEMSAQDSWLLRKREAIESLHRETALQPKILWLSDKLSNMRSIYRMHREQGDRIWEHFHQRDPAMHEWYYREVAKAIDVLRDTAAYEEYTQLIDKVFGKE